MLQSPSLSPQAEHFLANYPFDKQATDFDRISDIRMATQAGFQPAAARAIKRHQLQIEHTTIAGVEVERITSHATDTIKGTMMYIFGGGFIVGCPASDYPIIGALAEYCQLEIYAPKYRLAPEHPAPAAATDCFAVWQTITQQTSKPLFLAGESAGGNLALVIAQQAIATNSRLPNAMALLSPAVDLRTDESLFAPTTHSDPTLAFRRIGEIARAYAHNKDLTKAHISPLFGDMQGLPPSIITTGTRDLLMAMCLRLYRQLKRTNVTVECHVWDGLWHVFEYYDDYPEADESLREIAAFLNQYCGSMEPNLSNNLLA